MPSVRAHAIRLSAMLSLAALAACMPSDYTDGITAFATAVDKANTAERTLIAAYQQNALDRAIAGVGRGSVSYTPPDLARCNGSPYLAGSCVVKLNGTAFPVTADESSFAAMTRYAALLSSVTTDMTCASLTADAKALGTAIDDIAKAAGNTTAGATAGAVGAIVTTVGCQAIAALELRLLRRATGAADPYIQQLTAVITHKDIILQSRSIRDRMAQLTEATVKYDASKSAADLRQVITLARAVDQAQTTQAGPVIQKLGELHQALTTDLDAPTVNLTRVESDALALITAASALQDAASTLAGPAGGSATANH